jgi:integrase
VADREGFEPSVRTRTPGDARFLGKTYICDIIDIGGRCHICCHMASLRRKSNSKFWFACFTLSDGTRTQRSTKTTDRRLAQKLANQFEEASQQPLTESQARRVISDIHRMVSGRALDSKSVRDYFAQWMAARAGTVAPTTLKEYQTTLDQFIETMGDRAGADIAFVTTADVANYRDRTAARLSVASTNKKIKIVRVVFQQAWRDGVIGENPAAKVQTLKAEKDRVERRAFRLDELTRIVAAAVGEWKGLILFGLYTGQRLGDIARLKWENLNLEQGTLAFTTRKTGRRQIIPLAKPLIQWLAEHSLGGTENFIFPESRKVADRSSSVGGLSNQFNDLMAEAGLIEKRLRRKKDGGEGRSGRRALVSVSFHSLRHTATSLMKNAGISPAIVQEFVGHDSMAISQNYTHIETEALRKAADSMPDLLNLAGEA